MAYQWSKEFHGIGMVYEDRVIRVLNDEALERYLESSAEHAMELARYGKMIYRKKFGKRLDITTRSLATEIKGHYRLQKHSFRMEKMIGKNKFCDWMIDHMCVIDCGEKAIDNNRFVWDYLAKVPYVKGDRRNDD